MDVQKRRSVRKKQNFSEIYLFIGFGLNIHPKTLLDKIELEMLPHLLKNVIVNCVSRRNGNTYKE